MRTSVLVVAAAAALGLAPAGARAGSIVGTLDPASANMWTFDETWTDGSATLELKITGYGAIGTELVAFFERFLLFDLPKAGWHPAHPGGSHSPPVVATTPPADTTTTTPPADPPPNRDHVTLPTPPPTDVPPPPVTATSATPTDPPAATPTQPLRPADGPPIAPVPEPSGVALAVSGLGALVLAARRRPRRA